jgi:release factor glutamine methyltransferase
LWRTSRVAKLKGATAFPPLRQRSRSKNGGSCTGVERLRSSTFTAVMTEISAIAEKLRGAGCVFAEEEARRLIGAAKTAGDLAAMVDRRVTGVPLEHVLGYAEFCGLRLAVAPGVFVPRNRTASLVREAAALAGGVKPVVVDLCCGCGAIGAALLATVRNAELYACEIDSVAAQCARENLPAATVLEGDLYEPLPAGLRGRIDVIVANVPYVPVEAIALLPPEARLHEPRRALDGGSDGLDVARRLSAEAPFWLASGGHLLIETSIAQAPGAIDIFARNGLVTRATISEDLDVAVIVGTLLPLM